MRQPASGQVSEVPDDKKDENLHLSGVSWQSPRDHGKRFGKSAFSWQRILLDSLRLAGAHEQAAALLARDPAAHAPLDHPDDVAALLDRLRLAGAHEQAAALASRAAAHAALDNPRRVGRLLDRLRLAGAHEQAAALLARDPAAHATLGNPAGVGRLLDRLRLAGAHEQAAALLARDPAAHAPLDHPAGVARLLDRLRLAGAHEQAAALADQLPAAGKFWLFLEQKGLADQFRFGREADGTPAVPWGWEDLDLWLSPSACTRLGPIRPSPPKPKR